MRDAYRVWSRLPAGDERGAAGPDEPDAARDEVEEDNREVVHYDVVAIRAMVSRLG